MQTCTKTNNSEGKCDFFFFLEGKKKHFLRHPLDTLPCVILSFCLGCEQSWPCYSKLLLSSAIGRAARVGIVTWQLCKAETETLHQIRASALCEAHHPGVYEAGKSLLEVLVCAVGKFLLCQGAMLLRLVWTWAACPKRSLYHWVLCQVSNKYRAI